MSNMDSTRSQPDGGSSGRIAPLQPTFDVFGLAKDVSGQLAKLLVSYADDNLQPISRVPLQNFGVTVAVDSRRIAEGQGILMKTQCTIINFLKLVIGLSGRGIASDVAQDHNLTGVFQFVAACTPTLKPDQTGALIYEMILLGSTANDKRLAPSSAVKQFVQSLNGYVDLMEENPGRWYTHLGNAAISHLPGGAWSELWSPLETKTLAEILHKVFESLLDTDNKLITLDGSYSGLFIATLFWWLRQEDTTISIRGDRILPTEGEATPRLSINLNRNQYSVSKWKIYKWRRVDSLKPEQNERVEEKLDHSELDYALERPHNHYPIDSAKYQMLGSGVSEADVEAIGRLAAALVDTAFEQGTIYDTCQTESLVIADICSLFFCNSYRTIIQHCGWETLNREPQDLMVKALRETFGTLKAQNRYNKATNSVEALGCALQECERCYCDSTGKKFVPRDGAFRDVAERAVHLATEAIYFALCMKFPKRLAYRPLTANRLETNASILGRLLYGSKGVSYWDFRREAIQAMLQGVTDVGLEDLIVSSNGHSVCAAALVNLERNATNRRIASSFYVVPGPLRLDHETSCFQRLVWKEGISLTFSRQRVDEAVSLFKSNSFCGLEENKAYNNMDVKIKHFVGTDHYDTTKDVLHVTSHVHRGSETVKLDGVKETLVEAPSVPTHWAKSIEAIVFSTQVDKHNLAHSTERYLAEEWEKNGWLDALAWNWPGQTARSQCRWLSRTSDNEQLRFFEAGHLSEGRKLFIRQQRVPLIQCLKEAFEICKEDREWAILS